MEEWEIPLEIKSPELLFIDSPARQTSNERREPPREAEDDPEYTEKPKRKTKYVYRKKAQQRYRERVKNENANIEAAYKESKEQLEILAANNRYLKDRQEALELLKTESDRLLDALMTAQKALPVDDACQAADSLLDFFFSGKGVATDDQVRRFMNLPTTISVKVDLDFMDRLGLLMGEWNVCYSSRDKIELRLKDALQSRIKLSVLFPLLNPEGILLIAKQRAAPPPGTHAGDASRKQLVKVLKELELDEKQKEAIIVGLKDYREQTASLRAEMAMAQLALCTGSNGVIDNREGSTRAETLIAVTERASVINSMPLKMIYAYVRLAAAVLEPFSVTQYANILLRCMPHLPDYISVGEIVSAGEV